MKMTKNQMPAELASYLQRIEDLRGMVVDLTVALPAEALNWRPIEGIDEHTTNSLAVLAVHIAGAEQFWIGETLGGLAPTRDRDAEFTFQATDGSEVVRRLERVGADTRGVFSTLALADLDGAREVRGRTVPVRWCILHVIDHTALHLGHMQITYQLWMGGKSVRSPRWFERLKDTDWVSGTVQHRASDTQNIGEGGLE
jgi:uncharacterized damage-inducible protein DinB